ncbi:23S rRNA (pseudouridine1915-N3)-methyltransferase [Acetitomaculum ruminis DSM 5522]|uniref:Ribosomal RNA large subunit methyltransferase H n=1 Tax=Acetitomaculum ruminis DSM 5522 TaxID=1120918 RepID=A0A1I0V7Z3_9FIRM|nr:23S rRNA (pseudouridine(1915)-N(3))-methyltransferase RlmH [Acetitomaculum ruminis]SFA72398.1 23S rRNA (pseudouridine1915-N3)-methyltransferase [Acetitomaculum ruminis DSM 5522]
MKINIIAVGKLKEKYIKDAVKEYYKRINAYSKINIIEVEDEKTIENPSKAEENKIKDTEGKRIKKHISPSAFLIVLAIEGDMLDSIELSDLIDKKMLSGKSEFTFVIGGSIGLSDEIIKMADFKLSFSKMTFPHQLMRVILLEQIYRAFKIIHHEPYHK